MSAFQAVGDRAGQLVAALAGSASNLGEYSPIAWLPSAPCCRPWGGATRGSGIGGQLFVAVLKELAVSPVVPHCIRVHLLTTCVGMNQAEIADHVPPCPAPLPWLPGGRLRHAGPFEGLDPQAGIPVEPGEGASELRLWAASAAAGRRRSASDIFPVPSPVTRQVGGRPGLGALWRPGGGEKRYERRSRPRQHALITPLGPPQHSRTS